MRSTRMAAAAALMATMAFTASATAQELDERITTLDRATPVAAQGGVVAWSVRDAATGLYRLAVLNGTRWGLVDVRPRTIPFDVGVGTGPNGMTVTYSRCAFEAPERFSGGLSVLPDHTRGRTCRMYGYEVARAQERRLGGSRNGVLPTAHGGRLAYAVPGSRRLREVRAVDGADLRERGRGPRGHHATSLDLTSRRRLASAWQGVRRSRLRLDGTLVARVGRPAHLLGMGFDAGVLFFRVTCLGTPSGCPEAYWAYRPGSQDRFSAPESSNIVAAAHGGGKTYALRGQDNGSAIGCSAATLCELVIEDTLEFSGVPR